MPALLEDPTSPLLYRMSGPGPYPTSENPQIPSSIFPRPVTLRDRVTIATLIPIFTPDAVPPRLLAYLCDLLNREIEDGDTYPAIDRLSIPAFGQYWFGNFGAVMILGDIGGIEAVTEMDQTGHDWNKLCLGSFYVKPNYPGRSSHICNGGFLVAPAARNKGVGKSMGQCYLDWAPQLNYTYSVFNLVYETNTASTKIWDSLGFKRIGRVPGAGNLKSCDEPVDGIIYGRDLKAEGDNVMSEERFDKIRYYLRHSLYPQGADRSEKSRLRSAATHYKLVGGQDGSPEKLMLKDKEVISDPQQQYDIAKQIHLQAHEGNNKSHGGINKTTALIAVKYHWVRIKETVSHVIKNCPECKETNKAPIGRSDGTRSRGKTLENGMPPQVILQPPVPDLPDPDEIPDLKVELNHDPLHVNHISAHDFSAMTQQMPLVPDVQLHDGEPDLSAYDDMAIDPQIMEQLQAHLVGDFGDHHPFVTTHMPSFADTSHLQQNHHHDPRDFTTQQQDDFMHDPNGTMMSHDHVMNDGSGAVGLSNMQPMGHVLGMDYMNPNPTNQPRYKQ